MENGRGKSSNYILSIITDIQIVLALASQNENTPYWKSQRLKQITNLQQKNSINNLLPRGQVGNLKTAALDNCSLTAQNAGKTHQAQFSAGGMSVPHLSLPPHLTVLGQTGSLLSSQVG